MNTQPVTAFWRLTAFLAVGLTLIILSPSIGKASDAQQGAPVKPVKPVVIYPEAFAESLPASEVPSELIKEGERRTVPPPTPAAFQAPAAGFDESAAGDEYEFPMFPLPKGEGVASQAGKPESLSSLSGEALTSGALVESNAVQGLNIPATTVNFEGLSNTDNFNAFGFRVSPPDTNGDVGPNHYVEMTNLLVRVWDKAGNPLTAPFKLSSLFTPLGGQCAAPDAGDPIVLYDPLADRWLLSQFAFTSISAPPYHECIAISKTGDPTGAYYLYDFITPGNEFPDYPKLGVWPDAYYMTTNQFLLGGSFDGAGVFAFERSKMLAGDPAASLIYFNLNLASFPEAIGGMLPADFDGLIPPPAGAPNTFAYFLANEFGDAIDGLRLFDFHADFANPLNSTFTERPESPLAVAPFNPLSPAGRRDIVQPPPATTTNALDAIADRLMFRLQYRNNGTNEWLVTNHTVNVTGSTTVGTYQAGIRYYQLQRSLAGGGYSVLEQGTFAPDGASRWMGSAAVDREGNLAVGYSVSSSSVFPSIRYAGRLATDPPGGLFQGEQTLIAGSGVQLSTTSRWGDYSAMMVDPTDDCTFWYTNQYYTAASQASSSVGWLTRIGSFKFDACTPAAQGILQGTITDAGSSTPINGALFEVSGGFSRSSGGSGGYSLALAPGTYSVTVSRFGYQTQTINNVVVTNGVVTTLDVALAGVPVITADGAALLAESFPPNGAIDPGETVTVDFNLKNIGFLATGNLVATLLPTGGVTNPSGPQNYGAIAAAGGTAARSFTFTADGSIPCGGSLTATLQLQDGATDLGMVSYTLGTGVERISLSEAFDGVAAPALPAGWTGTVVAGLATNNWRTVTTTVDTPPNAAFAPDPSTVHDIRLDSTIFTVQSASAQLTFRNNYITETGFDGGVLEISLNGGPFIDILAAGGSFVSGGYNRTLSTGFSNPLPGRQAWSGNSSGYINTVANLPAAAGQNVQLRWRMGSDSSVASTGWWIDSIEISDGFACSFQVIGDNAALTAESFPANGVIDPGEIVAVDFRLRNTGTAATTSLVATLLPTGGVQNPSGPESYGAISPNGGTGTRNFVFRADPSLTCGGSLVATLQLQDGAQNLGTVSFSFTLGVPSFPLVESFDGVTAPALPAGWTGTVFTGLATNNWRTVTTSVDTPPNTAFAPDPSTVHDIRLDSPAVPIQSANARLSFRNNYNTESGFDGGVLEISLGGGPFVDILAAGGSFASGGYNRTLSTGFSNPLPGRQAWSGNSNGYTSTIVLLPAAAAGQQTRLRWRMGTDSSVSGIGWRVDTVQLSDGFLCAANQPPAVNASPASQSVQYSDPIAAVTITGTDAPLDTPLTIATQWKAGAGSFTPGLPAWLSLTAGGCASGSCSWTLKGTALAAPGIYVVRATVTDQSGGSAAVDITITVTKEDALVTYTGPLFASTGSVNSSTANVTLAATVRDISVLGLDAYPGDIRNATVSFVDRDNGNAVLCTAGVGLVNPADTKVGTATCSWTANLGSQDSLTVQVGLIVTGYYTRNSTSDDEMVTVSKPLATNFITGGGYLVLANSAGQLAGEPGTKMNFGGGVKFTKKGTNLLGRINLIFRRMEADGLHTYQIKSTALNSLVVNPGPGTAVINTKANLIDITNPDAPIIIDGNAVLQVTMDDNGEPGTNDTLGVTLWNTGGGLWFSSRWNEVKTVEQALGGGNLMVH